MTENDCHNVFAMLSEYLDRELPEGTCDELDRHIRDCAPCVEFVEAAQKRGAGPALCTGCRAIRDSRGTPRNSTQSVRKIAGSSRKVSY